MTPGVLIGYFTVPVLGGLICAVPAVTRPTLPFGVRVPADHAGAPVVRRERDTYVRYAAAIAACATAAVFLSWGHGVVIGQAYVTVLWTGLMLLIYRSRPDLDPADPARSLHQYRRLLGGLARALFVMLALVDASLLLHACQVWRVTQLPTSVVLLPLVVGLLVLISTALRAGRERAEAEASGLPRARAAGVTARDDDRWWKAGLIYVNRDDPAIMVPARFGFGWTFNLGHRSAWLVVAGTVAAPAGLALLLR